MNHYDSFYLQCDFNYIIIYYILIDRLFGENNSVFRENQIKKLLIYDSLLSVFI